LFRKGRVHRWASPGFVVVVIVDDTQKHSSPQCWKVTRWQSGGGVEKIGKSKVFKSQKLKKTTTTKKTIEDEPPSHVTPWALALINA